MNYAKTRCQVLSLLVLAAMAACDGSTPVGEARDAGRGQLLSVQVGRLVDVYAYRRIDPVNGDRRDRFNRRLARVATNVPINPNIEAEALFDAAGAEIVTADYEFLPFDKAVGHEELVILWDDQVAAEAGKFEAALANAQQGLPELAAAYRGQPTSRPIPIVPRNAAIVLNFSNSQTVDQAFFLANPGAIQLLEFKSNPATTTQATDLFRILPTRVLPQGNRIVLDTTILGGEGAGISTPGLPLSADNVTANIRVAIPSRGGVVSTFYAKDDPVPELNGTDSTGLGAVIRDFRSGNLADGVSGRMPEPEAPMIVGSLAMGITAVDAATGTLTINKRSQFVPVRGRYPFVDGPLGANGLPRGPLAVPTTRALRSGDIITQVVDVNGFPVTLRAEVLHNLDVGTVVGDPALPQLGQVENALGGTSQGEMLPVARVRVALLNTVLDSSGKPVFFQASTNPLGRDCVLRARYYEDVPFVGGQASVSDAGWRHYFVRIDPQPVGATTPGSQVLPNASVAVEFTKPIDIEQVDNTSNFMISNRSIGLESFATQFSDPKRATARVVPTRLSDIAGDGTVLRLQPQMGFFHLAGQTETYCVHVRLGSAGVTDLAGKVVDVFDRPSNPLPSWSVDFTLAAAGAENRVGWHSWLFSGEDEDGTLPGSVDFFGQYRLENGRLIGGSGVRFSRTADNQNLGSISRIHRGECWNSADDGPPPPTQPVFPAVLPPPTAPFINGVIHPGLLYWQPRMSDTINPPFVPQVFEYWQTVAQPVGRVAEPHKPQGSRMQMRYLEDDFSLDYRQPSEFGIDVEQLYWSPFNDETILYDVFDRYTMSLAHSRRRPDERFEFINDACFMIDACMNSSLSLTFSENVLEGSQAVPVFQDKIYQVNPNAAFRVQGVTYVPYPDFDRSYTWRDSRLVTVDAAGEVVGLGGAQEPGAQAPNDDQTANVDSPWILSEPDPEFVIAGFSTWVMDAGDFLGNLQRDLDPIALPLLVDFKVFPDSAVNGIAGGYNGFQVAMLGPPSNFANPAGPVPGGYYDAQGAGYPGRPAWPRVRVHATGGVDLVTGADILIDPANQLLAQASSTKDAGLGNAARALFNAPAGDGMLHWARADFVRKVSTVTFGFFDTLQPQLHHFVDENGAPGAIDAGFPNLVAIDSVPAQPVQRVSDLLVQIDPPQARQPAGTSVVVELRGAEAFDNDNNLYNPIFNGGGIVPDDTFAGRGNLLNPNYACEAYRYSTANLADGSARVPATGLTPYVTEDKLGQIRIPATGLLPRFLNLRLVMTNNVDVSPSLSPSLRSMSVVYRVQTPQ